MSLRLILNADDLGMDESTDDSIFGLMKEGRITSATMMANGLSISSAIERSREFTGCSFGVHLNLTQFEPLTSDGRLEPLLDDSGELSSENESIVVTRATRVAVLNELSAQIDRLYSAGIDISHLDSHQHVHNNPSMFLIIKRLQREFGIRRVRLTRMWQEDTTPYAFSTMMKKRFFNAALRRYRRSITTDGFTSLVSFMNNADDIGRRCCTCEIMLHPGKRQQEDAIIASDWRGRLPFESDLISYHEL